MAIRTIDDSILQGIAEAIQTKDGGGKMYDTEMRGRIEAIPTGGGTLISKTITQNGVYNASSDNADGYDVVTVDVPEKNTLDDYFANTLEVVNIPSAVLIGGGFFQGQKRLTDVIMPNVKSIGNTAFFNCQNLALTSLPNGVTSIGLLSFARCTGIPYLDFSNFDHIPTVQSNSFNDTTFPFYFRDQQQLDEWAAATNWSTYANRFRIKPSGVI